MDHDEFLQLIYDHFRRVDAWPRVRDIQVPLRGRVNVRLLAAEIGPNLVACEEGPDGVCFLQLEGLGRCRHAEEDINTFLAAVRFVAHHFIENGPTPVTSDALAESLKLDASSLRRLGLILFRTGGPFSGGTWKPDGSTFSVNPREDAMFYEEVRTLDAFFDTRRNVTEQEIATSTARSWPRRSKQPSTPAESASKLVDSHLKRMNVFISWSGKRSHQLALLLHDWLPSVIQAVRPYVSSEDILKGTRWPMDLARELEETAFGILCIVPGNADAAWLNFEAGALSKIVKDARVVPLLFGLGTSALVGHPLGQFQAAVFGKSDVLKTLKSMNERLGSAKLPDERLVRVFEQWWPKLEQDVQSVPPEDNPRERPLNVHSQPSEKPDATLDEIEERILAMWATGPADLKLQVGHVAGILRIPEQRAQFYLDQLTKKKYLHDLLAMGGPTRYLITHEGRRFLVGKGLT